VQHGAVNCHVFSYQIVDEHSLEFRYTAEWVLEVLLRWGRVVLGYISMMWVFAEPARRGRWTAAIAAGQCFTWAGVGDGRCRGGRGRLLRRKFGHQTQVRQQCGDRRGGHGGRRGLTGKKQLVENWKRPGKFRSGCVKTSHFSLSRGRLGGCRVLASKGVKRRGSTVAWKHAWEWCWDELKRDIALKALSWGKTQSNLSHISYLVPVTLIRGGGQKSDGRGKDVSLRLKTTRSGYIVAIGQDLGNGIVANLQSWQWGKRVTPSKEAREIGLGSHTRTWR